MSLVEESESLHERVRAFARGEGREGFDGLALAIARFQAKHSARFRKLIDESSGSLDHVDRIPAVPTEAFRLTRVAVHPPELDEVRFVTSGTSSEARGVHPMRTTRTYRQLALAFGKQALIDQGGGARVVVALAPHPGSPPTSSLGFMMQSFMEAFDGRALSVEHRGAAFEVGATGRWLASSDGVDTAGLRRAALVANERGEPLLVLGTSFALVLLLDALAGARLPAPKRTVVMQTGGFKGKTREIEPAELRRRVARAFRIAPENVVSEYGMTELTSQLYEPSLPDVPLSGPSGIYVPPPWLRVTPVSAATLTPMPDGEVGIARFVDLGNVDSAVAIQTQDLIRRREGGIELLGRRKGAPSRGCSLAIDELVGSRT